MCDENDHVLLTRGGGIQPRWLGAGGRTYEYGTTRDRLVMEIMESHRTITGHVTGSQLDYHSG